jgi:16S rRNA C967 or C1407 C5-methylase (RsmB/RsmF family)/NOL1/NOP2/fmu family ribosome biogenesis protein
MINDKFRTYLEEAIGHENALVAFSAFEQDASVSIRYNPFKAKGIADATPVRWNAYGRLLSQRPVFTLDPLFHAGVYYVQDSSSMFVGHAFREIMKTRPTPVGRPLRVLDLCAAPGGKTTDLAASLREMYGDAFILVSNEVMKARVGILADNVALWGDPNVVVTSDDPKAFASLPGFFDVIVTDVPCSGEGMFRKDEEAQRQWSVDNVALCEARQRRIIADVWPALAPGGVMIYSTCTFNRYENDGNVAWIEEELGAECITEEDILNAEGGVIKTGKGYSLVPGFVPGEGQYCSALVKTSDVDFSQVLSMPAKKRGTVQNAQKVSVPAGLDKYFSADVRFRMKADLVTAVPESVAGDVSLLEGALHVIMAGCAAGMVKGKDFVPNADLALSLILAEEAFPVADVDLDTALAFLHRDAVTLRDCEKGFIMLRYEGADLGFVKNIGNRCNNLHPQSRRIRMNIK